MLCELLVLISHMKIPPCHSTSFNCLPQQNIQDTNHPLYSRCQSIIGLDVGTWVVVAPLSHALKPLNALPIRVAQLFQ